MMNEKQAIGKGFEYTGDYERSMELIKNRQLEYKGYKTVIVTIPDSPLSRGFIGKGYSIFAEKKYFIDKEKNELKEKLSRLKGRREWAIEKYEQEVKEINDDMDKWIKRLVELESNVSAE